MHLNASKKHLSNCVIKRHNYTHNLLTLIMIQRRVICTELMEDNGVL